MPSPEPTSLNLDHVNRSALRNGAAIGIVFGVVPFVLATGSLIAGASIPVVGAVLLYVFSTPLAFLGVACGNAWIQALRRGADWLVVEDEGLRRDVRVHAFAVAWPELSGIEVVATEAIPGDNPYRIYANQRRRAGSLTALRMYPRNPDAFAAAHPPLVTAGQPALPQRLIGAPFGVVFPMEYDERAELVAALQRYAGAAFRGVQDETTAGRRAR